VTTWRLTAPPLFSVHFHLYMTQSVPDNISMDDLHEFLETACSEDEIHSSKEASDDFSPEFIQNVAQEALELASEKCPDPLVHKVMVMMIVSRMIEWHNHCAQRQLEDDNIQSAACWYRDAGKFQSMMDSLRTIGIGPSDFTVCDD